MSLCASLCPICGADAGPPLLSRTGVPVLLNRPYATAEAAGNAPSSRIEFSFCRDCEFGFNAAFDPSLAVYDDEYENDQGHSPAFQSHLEQVLDRAVLARGAWQGPVVEIGCGQAEFLRRLASRIGNGTAFVGIDPCCRAVRDDRDSVRLFRKTLDGMAAADLPGNPSLVCARHVLEHVFSPVDFLKEWIGRELVRPGTPILLETPSLEWIARRGAFADLIYEHCNYFSARALRCVLLRAGFEVRSMELAFGGQYFLLSAQREERASDDAPDFPSIGSSVEHFCNAEFDLRQSWSARLAAAGGKGRVAVWGAGAKGVSFATTLDSGRHLIDCLIDVNPVKQGLFAAVSGHPIVSAETAGSRNVVTAVVMNPCYLDEIRSRVATLRTTIELIPFEGSASEIYH